GLPITAAGRQPGAERSRRGGSPRQPPPFPAPEPPQPRATPGVGAAPGWTEVVLVSSSGPAEAPGSGNTAPIRGLRKASQTVSKDLRTNPSGLARRDGVL